MGMMDQKNDASGSIFIGYISGAIIARLLMLMLRRGSFKNFAQVPYGLSIGRSRLIIVGPIGLQCRV